MYWRLALDGLPLASVMRSRPAPCCCGCPDPHPDRRHHFWACPVAAAVRASLATQLSGAQLTPVHVWLAQPPPDVHEGVWGVVCLAAVYAMDSGRRQVVARRLAAQRQQPAGQQAPAPPEAGAQLTTAAANHAVARLWDLLQEFCTLGAAPAAWREALPAAHPFVRWDAGASRWRLHRLP